MKKTFAAALLLAGFAAVGAVYAYDMGPGTAKGPDFGSPVRVEIMSTTGSTVRLFTPQGNEVLCKGESVPIYRIASNMKGRLSSKDLTGLKPVGEVRVDYLVGESYAEGRLTMGDAKRGDIASKPSALCLAPKGSLGKFRDFIPQG